MVTGAPLVLNSNGKSFIYLFSDLTNSESWGKGQIIELIACGNDHCFALRVSRGL